jgi:hypothetical protein
VAAACERLRDVAPPIRFQKAGSLIEMRDQVGALGYLERKVLNALLAWRRDVPNASAGAWTLASTARVRDALGQAGQDGNRRLRAALACLTEVPYQVETVGYGRVDTPLLGDFDIPAASGLLAYRLPDAVLQDVDKPFSYGELDLTVCSDLGSKYALVLYELAALLVNRDHPRVTLSLADIRARLGSGQRYLGAAALKKHVVEPAVATVNARTPLRVTTTWLLGYRKRETGVLLAVANAE